MSRAQLEDLGADPAGEAGGGVSYLFTYISENKRRFYGRTSPHRYGTHTHPAR